MSQLPSPADGAPRLTAVQWAVCVVAAIGFAFDIYELLMLPLIARPALMELGGLRPGSDEFAHWLGLLFYVPAICGGIFGLLGGYLTDRLGRRRVLTWSILLYAVSAFAAGFSTSLPMLLVLRSLTFIGVCIEFVAATAWLAELFDDPRQRERMLGYTQAFSSFGGLLVAIVNGAIIIHRNSLPAISLPGFLEPLLGEIGQAHQHEAWRYTLMSGIVPALPLIVIRPWLPESPKWKAKKQAGLLRRPRLAELFAPELRRTTIVTTLMVAMGYGAAFGAIQMTPQIVARMPEVRAETAGKQPGEKKEAEQAAAAEYMKAQEVGGLLGRVLLAFLAIRIVSRGRLIRIFQGPGLFVMPFVFVMFAVVEHSPVLVYLDLSWLYLKPMTITPMHLLLGLAGLLTIGQFSFWGNYLPRVYPSHLRGTGESFAANVGGRMIGTSFAAVTPLLSDRVFKPLMPGSSAEAQFAFAAAVVGFSVYGVGFVASFFLPEPSEGALPD